MAKEVQWAVQILGKDVSADVDSIDSVQNRLDIPKLTEFSVSDLTLTLMPNLNDYAPEKASNFFTANAHVATGYRAPITVQGGFRGETLKTLFTGVIVELNHDVTGQGYRLVATDASVILRNETIQDFGLRKNSNLRIAGEQETIRGEYQFSEPVIPVSEGSVSGTLGGRTLTEVQNLANEGSLSEENFQLSNDGSELLTELAPTGNAVLNATYKAPYRGIGIERIIRELLTTYAITPTAAKLPQMRTQTPHWSHISRPAYEVEYATGTNNTPFGWNGYVTDMVRNTNGDFYMLYSHRGRTILPQLLKYTAATDSWSSVRQASAHAEWWQLATTDFNEFFILQTTGLYEEGIPRRATYNPAEHTASTPTQTSILKINLTDNTTTTFANSGTRRPQLAVNYWYGFIAGTGKLRANETRLGFLPDTRTGFRIAENALWYRFANTTQFGLARLRTSNGQGESVITLTRDEFANEASFDFTLDLTQRRIYASHTEIGETGNTLRSRHLVYYQAMPTSY